MNTRDLLNVLKTAQKFINSKATGGHANICRSAYFMNTGGKLEVRATNGHNAFSSALDCVEPDAWKAPAIISDSALAQAIAALRGAPKNGFCNVAETATGIEIAHSTGAVIALPNISNAEAVREEWRYLETLYFTPENVFDSTISASGCLVPASQLALALTACDTLRQGEIPALFRHRTAQGWVFWRVSCGQTWIVVMGARDDAECTALNTPEPVDNEAEPQREAA